MNRPFQMIDVFSDEYFAGNPLPVILDAEGLSSDEMQRITRWMNHSETAFLLPPTDPIADYRVRIFTLDREMPFAGHPTLGSCHAWLAGGGQAADPDTIYQECGVGLVPLRRIDTNLAFAAPALIRSGTVEEEKLLEIAAVLQISRDDIVDAEWADNGPGWVVIMLDSAQSVLAIEAKGSHPTRLDIGIVGPYAEGHQTAFELRALCTDHVGAIREDPVTGSLNASVAQWLFASNRASGSYVASQGARVGSAGRIYLSQDTDNTVWVGGKTKTRVEGHINIE